MPSHQTKRVNTVLFDLDDTLLDSYRARIQALQDVFTQAKITGLKANKFLASLQGAPFEAALDRLSAAQKVPDSLFIRYRRAYWLKKTGYICLYPGIREMLDTLKSRGVKLGIVTSKGRDFEFEGSRVGCINELKELNIADIFSTIVGYEDVSKHKPNPDGINLALDKLGSQPEDTLFVGDSAADIQAAHNAGCRSCLATWGVTDDAGLPEGLQAQFMVDSPQALLSLNCLK